jgi:vacuolar-type H+-ATPase subunit D/Vma8
MQDILVDKKNALIQKYIEKINNIEKTTQKYRAKLLDILKELFVKIIDVTEKQPA